MTSLHVLPISAFLIGTHSITDDTVSTKLKAMALEKPPPKKPQHKSA